MQTSLPVILASLLGSGVALAESNAEGGPPVAAEPSYDTVLALNLGAGQFGTFGFSYERVLTQKWSLSIQTNLLASYDHSTSAGSDCLPPGNVETWSLGGGVIAGAHGFPLGRAPGGFWLGPTLFAEIARTHTTETGAVFLFSSSNSSLEYTWGARASAGYNFILSNRFMASISANAGVGFARGNTSTEGFNQVPTSGLSLSLSTQVGFGWAL